MRKITKVTIRWECGICKEKYPKVGDAAKCEKMPIEDQVFKLGDKVQNIEPRTTSGGHDYYFDGKVIKVIGPKPADLEYEMKWLSGKPERIDAHVFQYEVEYWLLGAQPKKMTARYYAPELIKLPKLQNRKVEKEGKYAR